MRRGRAEPRFNEWPIRTPETALAAQTIRGRIDRDAAAALRTLLLVIDGRDISWDEFGRMLVAFEGWQFKLEIVDRSDEAKAFHAFCDRMPAPFRVPTGTMLPLSKRSERLADLGSVYVTISRVQRAPADSDHIPEKLRREDKCRPALSALIATRNQEIAYPYIKMLSQPDEQTDW